MGSLWAGRRAAGAGAQRGAEKAGMLRPGSAGILGGWDRHLPSGPSVAGLSWAPACMQASRRGGGVGGGKITAFVPPALPPPQPHFLSPRPAGRQTPSGARVALQLAPGELGNSPPPLFFFFLRGERFGFFPPSILKK